ncbi:hypothetical protein BDY17DRAFT_145144 [Neohortaea acidophila]|uniref:Uncharacterized protein n=1 Tax=Neohortaea acidophila TaxID=245834 RepID=A0A6A6PV30_9PEZI|nr:uncharacterized protein BDY17DRAFT_145144 [Neohortaea acidophila]KAF2483313.1 hypothetical protein BDY17DRAFT_145144 [Neohortaea acidophila]
MKMELSTQESQPSEPGQHFYVRSWCLTSQELEAVVTILEKPDLVWPQVRKWRQILDVHALDGIGSQATYTIRYLGTCASPSRPIDRHIQDLVSPTAAFIQSFTGALRDAFPDWKDSAQVHRLPDAHIPPTSLLDADELERLLIAFFDRSTLLNRQPGGFHVSYVSFEEDAQGFRALRTDFWRLFQTKARHSANVTLALAAHFNQVQSWANSNPLESGTHIGKFSDRQRLMIQQSATPLMYEDMCVMVFIGKDQTLEEYRSCDAFITGPSRAGGFARSLLRRNVQLEAQGTQLHPSPMQSFNPTNGPWCFVDLWPWLRHTNISQAKHYLQAYLGIVQPIIAVSFSGAVNRITRANFMDGPNILRNIFGTVIGEGTIQFSEYDHQSQEFTASSAFINIPHIDPGYAKHHSQHPKYMRIVDMTMQYTFLVGNIALQFIDQRHFGNRLELCRAILDHVATLRETSPPHRRFLSQLRQARDEYIAFSYKETANPSNDVKHIERPNFDRLRPEDCDPDTWFDDPKSRRDAAQCAGLYTAQSRDAPINHKPEVFLTPQECQGRLIKVGKRGLFSIPWKRSSDGALISTKMHTGFHEAWEQRHYMFFTKHGIDLVKPSGEVIRRLRGPLQNGVVTIEAAQFSLQKDAQELWMTACRAHGLALEKDVGDDNTGDGDPWEGVDAGVPLLNERAMTETPKQNRPPLREDANWLLNEFICQTPHLANGGTFRTGTVDRFPDSTEDLQRFVTFLKQPQYRNHPYAPKWLFYFDRDVPKTQTLAKNLPMLRATTKTRIRFSSTTMRIPTMAKHKKSSKGIRVNETRFELGGPGSAMANPFSAGSGQSCVTVV